MARGFLQPILFTLYIFINYSFQYNLNLKMISKTTLALSAFLLLLSLSQALKMNSHNQDEEVKKDKYKPVQDLTSLELLYAVAKTKQNNKELNGKSELSSATYKLNYYNETIYNLTFTTNGVQSTYKYYSSDEQNWPEVIAAIKYLQDSQPAANNLYNIRYSTQGVKGENFTVVFNINGADDYTNFYAEIGVDSDLKATLDLFQISCQSIAGCIDDRLALQIFNANNKLFKDNPNAQNPNYDLSAFRATKFDEVTKALTVVETLTPRNRGDPTIVATISVTPKTFEITYA